VTPHFQLSIPQILGAATALFGVLQAVKKAGLDRYVYGRIAVGFNVAFAFIGTIAVSGSLDVNTLCTAVAVALAAAGLHGTIKTIAPRAIGSATAAALLLAMVFMPLTGCAHGGAPQAPHAAKAWDVRTYEALDDARVAYESAYGDAIAAHRAGQITDDDWRVIQAAATHAHDVLLQASNAMVLWESSAEPAQAQQSAAVDALTFELAGDVKTLVTLVAKAKPHAALSAPPISELLWRGTWHNFEVGPRG